MIVVTGAAGFIGQHLIRRLLTHTTDAIVGFDNLYRGRWDGLCASTYNGRLQLLTGDIRDLAALETTFRNSQIVYHLAAQSNVLGAIDDVGYSFETNVLGTLNVLRAAQLAGVKCVVFTSSREVYGEQTILPVNEDSFLIAKNAYGASKIAAEAYCRIYDSPQMRVIVLRLANVYGPGDFGRVIPTFVERSKKQLPLILYGGEQEIDFISVDVVVEALCQAAIVRPQGPINIGSGRGTTIKKLAQFIVERAGSSVGLQVVAPRDVEVVRFVASTQRMQQCLNVMPPSDPLASLPALLI